jgi:hypothetical protein
MSCHGIKEYNTDRSFPTMDVTNIHDLMDLDNQRQYASMFLCVFVSHVRYAVQYQ